MIEKTKRANANKAKLTAGEKLFKDVMSDEDMDEWND